VLEGGKGLTEVATELGVSTGQLSPWRPERLAAGSAEALAAHKAEAAEMQRLKRENKRLEEENLILKKAAAFLAKGIAWRSSPSCRPSGATTPCPRCAAASAPA
jgi:transposase